MTPRTRTLVIAVAVALVAAVVTAWMTVAVRRRIARPKTQAVATAPAPPVPNAAAGRKIKVHLFYVSMDGTKLSGVEREVAYGDGVSAQAQEIVAAQLAAPPEPLVSAIPKGTTLRAIYVNERGEAYVDLSKEVSTAHTGGTEDERLTIYAIVNALTANLPSIMSVQLLVDGKEVDTLAGHIDLRRPLSRNPSIVE
ncbi:MAG TPA: GerMN domain-containing protein [Vicinamibacterales bacterium]|nr:GerMN domain-containing protein [Vicinamibacterales bacterium]